MALEMEMERSLTSTLKSTPFSINDILTKNNTTLFRRCSSSGHLSPIDRKSNTNDSECDEPSDETLSQHLANSMRFLKYSGYDQHHDTNIDQSTLVRHSASQQYLFNNNNNNNHHHSNNNNNTNNNSHGGEKFHNINTLKHKRSMSHGEKTSAKPIKYYNFPLMFERPLDMRRCADGTGDDSGEKNPIFFHTQTSVLLEFILKWGWL